MQPRFVLAGLVLLALGLTLVKSPDSVQACAIAPPKGGQVEISDETAVIVWDSKAKVEHFIRSASFASTSAEFGFLVPTPTRPEVAEASPVLYDELTRITEPRTEVRTKTRISGCFDEKTAFDRVGAAILPNAAAPGGVQVLERSRVGAFDYAILKAEDPGELREWLGKNGFDARPELENWFKAYTKAKWILTAFKLASDAVGTRVNGSLSINASAVRMSFPTDRPFYPYREPEDARSLIGRTGFSTRSLRVFVLADARVDGVLGDGNYWPGRTVWAGPVEGKRIAAAVTKGKLPDGLTDRDWTLTEFVDQSYPRPGTDELYFDRAIDQSPVERPPNIVYEYREIPVGVVAVVMCAAGAVLLVGTWLLIRRLTKPHR